MLAISIIVFNADKSIYMPQLFIFALIYLIVFVISIIVEFGLRHYVSISVKNVFIVFFRNLKEDVLIPFLCIRHVLSYLFEIIGRLFPSKRKYYWRRNKTVDILLWLYILIISVEIIAFCVLNGFI